MKKAKVSKQFPNKETNIKKSHNSFAGKRQNLYVGFILVLTALVFLNTINNDFTNWDDETYIHDNPYIKDLSAAGIKNIFSNAYFGNYHPFTTLSYAIEYKYFGLNPKIFHFTNLLLHLLNTLMVFVLFKLISKRVEIPLITALLFALHPMHVESVAWISERKDVLYTFFFLGSLIFYLKHLQSKSGHVKYLVYAFLLFIASLMSKSAAVTLSPVLLLMAFYINKKISVKDIISTLPFFALSILFGLIAIKTQVGAIGDLGNLYSVINRIFLPAYALFFYIFRFIIPYSFSPLHPYPSLEDNFLPVIYYIAPFVLIAIVILVIKARKEYKQVLIFGLLFFLINISLVIQVIGIGQAVVAERYTYVPYIGLSFIASFFFAEFYKRYKNFMLVFGLIFLAYLTFTTWQQNKVWKDSGTLWTHALEMNPVLEAGLNNLGLHLSKQDRDEEAYDLFTRLIEINPDYEDVHNNRATSCFKLKDFDCVIRDLNISIEKKPDKPKLYNNRGLAHHQLKEYDKALLDFNKAIELDSVYTDAYSNRSNLRSDMNDFHGAINDIDAVILLSSGNSFLYNTRGIIKGKMNDFSGALNDFTEAFNLDNNNSEALINSGIALLNLGRIEEACEKWYSAHNQGNSNAMYWVNQYCK
ncbi:MAG: tetratricopeptide repeat protein [Bacteroidales bacterium]|nr:tetratricopeptide repeat protein [Bacteroidales bacterium]